MLLSDTELTEDGAQDLVDTHDAGDAPDRPQGQSEILAAQLRPFGGQRRVQALGSLAQGGTMPSAGEGRRSARFGQRSGLRAEGLSQRLQAKAGSGADPDRAGVDCAPQASQI